MPNPLTIEKLHENRAKNYEIIKHMTHEEIIKYTAEKAKSAREYLHTDDFAEKEGFAIPEELKRKSKLLHIKDI